MLPKINSAHGSDTRNIINRAIEVLNLQGKAIQDLVAEGQLTPEQYAELIIAINGMIKSGEVKKYDLGSELIAEIERVNTMRLNTADRPIDVDEMNTRTKQLFTGGAVAVVGVNAVGRENVKLKAIHPENTTFLEPVGYENLINRDNIKPNTYVRGDSEGQDGFEEGLYATDFIPLRSNTEYYYHTIYQGYYAFYDSNKNYISGTGIAGETNRLPNPFTTPSNTVYGRFTLISDKHLETCWINVVNEEPDGNAGYKLSSDIILPTKEHLDGITPTEYDGDDIAIFNKIMTIGDSLTAGTFNTGGGEINYVYDDRYAYPKYLQKMTGVSVINKGHSGITTKGWFDAYESEDLSGYDCAIIQLGVNDLFRESTLEETKTYLTNIINKLKADNRGIKIFVSTIIPAISYSQEGYIAISNAIREVVSSTGDDVYLTDLAKHGHTKDEEAYNNGHLSAYGYWRLAKDYKAYISYIIANNKLEFRNIQFAGTDYTY